MLRVSACKHPASERESPVRRSDPGHFTATSPPGIVPSNDVLVNHRSVTPALPFLKFRRHSSNLTFPSTLRHHLLEYLRTLITSIHHDILKKEVSLPPPPSYVPPGPVSPPLFPSSASRIPASLTTVQPYILLKIVYEMFTERFDQEIEEDSLLAACQPAVREPRYLRW